MSNEVTRVYWFKFFIAAAVGALVSLIAGGVVVVIRLHDARLTARTVRYRIEQKPQKAIDAIRDFTDDLGWWTNCLIPVQFIAFALAAVIFLIWVFLSFSRKFE